MKLDILAFGAHPDDVELSCSGTLLHQITNGNTAGIVDLTRGELGSRGTTAIRDQEALKAAEILGITVRHNLDLPDGFFENNRDSQIKAVELIRRYKPDIVLCNATDDRHPDHGRAAKLVEDACFLAGLMKIETAPDGRLQEAWRPRLVLHYIQDRYLRPDIVVDISPYWEKRMESILAHASQFYDPHSSEPETYIASKGFFEMIDTRAREMGRANGFKYAEGFTCSRVLGVKDIASVF